MDGGFVALQKPLSPAATWPIVLYNGSDRWMAPGGVAELPGWPLAARSELAPFQGWDYVLLSLERLLSSGGLAHLPLDNRAAATLRVLHAWASALLVDMGGAESSLPDLAELEGLNGGNPATNGSGG